MDIHQPPLGLNINRLLPMVLRTDPIAPGLRGQVLQGIVLMAGNKRGEGCYGKLEYKLGGSSQ